LTGTYIVILPVMETAFFSPRRAPFHVLQADGRSLPFRVRGDCLLEIVRTGLIPPPGVRETPLSSLVVPRPVTAAFADDYSTTPTGPVNTALQGWVQVMHCGPVRG
jgi:hypothetical protein